MLPTTVTMSFRAGLVFLRRYPALLVSRVVLDFIASSALALPLLLAGDVLARQPFAWPAWTAAFGMALIGVALSAMVRVCLRAGMFRSAFSLMLTGRPRSLFAAGCEVFADAFLSLFLVAIIEVLAAASLIVAFILATSVALAFGWLGQAVAALFVASLVALSIGVCAFLSLALALAMIDGRDLVHGWASLRGVLALAGRDARGRALGFALLSWCFSPLLLLIELVSIIATLASDADHLSFLVWSVPLVVVFCATLLDVSLVIVVAALTDRLPLGFASRVVFVTPAGPAPEGAA